MKKLEYLIDHLSKEFFDEAKSSPKMFEDLAAMETYMSESYDGRTFIELIQNADDADSSKMLITLVDDNLIIANNGKHFNENDILSICRSGASKKERGKYIGYRGVGFKSSTTISNEIIIYSDGICFTFSKNRCASILNTTVEKVPTIRIPFLYQIDSLDTNVLDKINELEEKGFQTIFIFKNANVKKFKSEISEFDSSWLIFLKNINQVKFDLSNNYNTYNINKKIITNEKYIIKDLNTKNSWLILKHYDVGFAFKYDKETGIIPCSAEDAVFHCFLPTIDKTGFLFKINADFSTDPSRKHIIYDEKTQSLLEHAYELLIDYIKLSIKSNDRQIYQIIKLLCKHTVYSKMAVAFDSGIKSILKQIAWIPTQESILKDPQSILINPKWMTLEEYEKVSQISTTFKSMLLNKDLYLQTYDLVDFIRTLGANEISYNEFYELISNVNFVSALDSKLCAKLFAYTVRNYDFDRTIIETIFVPLDYGYIQIKDLNLDIKLNLDFINILTDTLKDSEKDILLNDFNLSLGSAKSKTPSLKSLRKKRNNDIVATWKSPIQNCISLESTNGAKVKDVSKSRSDISLICTNADNSTTYILVKSVDHLGDTFALTEDEYLAAEEHNDNFKLYIFSKSKESVEYTTIINPISSLKMNKVIKSWEWLCKSYEYKLPDNNFDNVLDKRIIQNISRDLFNDKQLNFLEKVIDNDGEYNLDEERLLIDQVNFVFDFYTGNVLFNMDNDNACIDKSKLNALKKVL